MVNRSSAGWEPTRKDKKAKKPIKNNAKRTKVPREGRERKTQLFQPTRDPTAKMHAL